MTPLCARFGTLVALVLTQAASAAPPIDFRETDLDEIVPVETSGHLDQLFRRRGMEEYLAGRPGAARRYFEYAAAYADKTSQLSLATLYRNGEGVERDLAMAYAWLDLAAERGYPAFLAEREAVWHSLDEAQQARAVELTTEIYTRYGDAIAKRRHRDQMVRYLRKSVASHPSLAGGHIVTIDKTCAGAVGGAVPLGQGGCRDDDYFTPERFDPETYWRAQDDAWMPRGEVEVKPLEVPPTRARRN